jgi:hypothetical protein
MRRIPNTARRPRAIALVLMTGSLACSSSRMTTVWKDSEYAATPLHKLVVVAARKDANRQRMWEDALVAELARHGVEGIPSYNMMTSGAVDSTRVYSLATQGGAEGMLVVRNAGQETNVYQVPGNIVRTPVGTVVDPYWGTLTTVYHEIATPGYVETEEVRRFAAHLLVPTGGTNRLVWGARVETIDAKSSQDAAKQTAGLVGSDLAKQGLIPKR